MKCIVNKQKPNNFIFIIITFLTLCIFLLSFFLNVVHWARWYNHSTLCNAQRQWSGDPLYYFISFHCSSSDLGWGWSGGGGGKIQTRIVWVRSSSRIQLTRWPCFSIPVSKMIQMPLQSWKLLQGDIHVVIHILLQFRRRQCLSASGSARLKNHDGQPSGTFDFCRSLPDFLMNQSKA